MLFLLSPAKSLDYESPLPSVTASQPQFVAQSAELIATLKKKTPKQIAELMDLSEALAKLNTDRYKAWTPKRSSPKNSNGRKTMWPYSAACMACCGRLI